MEPIPPARVYFPEEDLEGLLPQLREILESGRLTLGRHTEAFERAFAAAHGKRVGIAVNSGTSALEIILRALRIQGEVVVPTNTFAATAFAVLHSGNRLVLADVNAEMSLDVADVRKRLGPDTAAVVLVHIGGRVVPETLGLVELCEDRGIPLIEDAAHAHGSRLGDRHAGAFGVASAFSFYPTKVMTSGEGGMILTDDDEFAATCRVLRDQGKAGFGRNLHTELGYNWRMSELHACVGVSQLRRLPEFLAARRRVARIYDEGLSGWDAVAPLLEREGMASNYYKYIAMPREGFDRARAKARLKESFGVSLSGEVYESPLHEQPVFQGHGEAGTFPVAEDLCRRHICLPVYASMADEAAGRVVDALRSVIA